MGRHGGGGGGPGGRPPITVGVARAGTGDMPITVEALGTVTPLATVNVNARVSGLLDKVGFREGQLVSKGQLLAQIDPRPFQVAVDQAQGQLTHDEAQLADARLDLARYHTLKAQDFHRRPDRGHSILPGETAGRPARHRPRVGERGQAQPVLHPHHRTEQAGVAESGTAADRSGQPDHRQRRHAHGGADPDRSDQRGLRPARERHSAGGQERRAFRSRPGRDRPGPVRRQGAGQGTAGDARQPHRYDHRHGEGPGRFRQRVQRPFPPASS